MNKEEIVNDYFDKQEEAVLQKLGARGHALKNYGTTQTTTQTGTCFTRRLVIHPKDDGTIVDKLTFEEASLKYQPVVMNVNVEIESEPENC